MNIFVRCLIKLTWGAACLLIVAGGAALFGEDLAADGLPDAPLPAQTQDAQPAEKPPPPLTDCQLRNAAATMAATAAIRADQVADGGPEAETEPPRIVGLTLCVPHMPPVINWYARFLNGPQVKALTPMQKLHLAGRDLVDPFNLMTIVGEGAIVIASNSHSAEGPGIHGLANYVGVSFTQDMVGEFFGTFLIPSLTHQDPHYHRMPQASVRRRIFHCLDQIVWTQGDNGKGMVNYADLVGFAADDEVDNLFVPGQQTNLPASAERYATGLALAPIDNFITEFIPDIASHIHVRVVLVQRIINQVARTEGAPAP